jgi:hypothetical protein
MCTIHITPRHHPIILTPEAVAIIIIQAAIIAMDTLLIRRGRKNHTDNAALKSCLLRHLAEAGAVLRYHCPAHAQ